MLKSNSILFSYLIIFSIATLVLITDFLLPKGIAIGVLYILPLFFTSLFKEDKHIYFCAFVFSLFVLIGSFKNQNDASLIVIITNRLASIIIIFFMSFILIKNRRIKNDLVNRNEQQESEIQQQLSTLYKSAIYSATDSQGVIINVNDLFCITSKYTRNELLGKTHRTIRSGFHDQEFYNEIQRIISSGNVWQGQICNKAKDGSLYWIYATISPFFNKIGEIEKYVSIQFDITKLKNQEEELTVAYKDLESFSYSVSHDLKAPLRSIDGFSKAILNKHKSSFDDESARWLNFIVVNTTRMSMLINDILNYSKIGRSSLTNSIIDMKLLALENFNNLKQEYLHKDIDFELTDLHSINGDTSMMNQIWQNLISNALKFSSPKERIKIKISSKLYGNYIVFEVSDNGVGYNEKYKEKLFEIFQRLHSNDEFEGTGVGLSIVSRIMQKHNGWIKSTSIMGEKTVFSFGFPINYKQ